MNKLETSLNEERFIKSHDVERFFKIWYFYLHSK